MLSVAESLSAQAIRTVTFGEVGKIHIPHALYLLALTTERAVEVNGTFIMKTIRL